MGGFFERMVQEVKRCLRKTLRNAKLDCDELHTVLVEIESTLNSRPLTYVSSDELDEPITPSHLVVGKRVNSIPIVSSAMIEEVDDSASGVEARRNYLDTFLESMEPRVCGGFKNVRSGKGQSRRKVYCISWRCCNGTRRRTS